MTLGDFICVYVIPICLILGVYLYLIFKALDKIYKKVLNIKKNGRSDNDEEEKQSV